MPHCHRGGGGVRWNILSEEKLDCVGALAALHSRLEHEEKGGKKKEKRGILSLYIPPEQPGVHSVSQQKGKNWICNSYIFSATLIVCVCSLGEGYLLLLHLLLALDTICVTNGAKGETHQHAAPNHHHHLSSPSPPLPCFLLSEQRNTDEGRGCHEL